jgi:hypothetical protein
VFQRLLSLLLYYGVGDGTCVVLEREMHRHMELQEFSPSVPVSTCSYHRYGTRHLSTYLLEMGMAGNCSSLLRPVFGL